MKIEEATFNPSQGWSLARSAKATKRGKFRALGPIQGGGVAKPPGPRGKELISAGLAELARVASSPKPAPKPDQAATPVEEFIRVVQFNRAGEEVWLLDRFTDPFGLCPLGSGLELNAPQDFIVWEELHDAGTPQEGNEVHYLIVDTGNYRVLEIVTAYGPDKQLLDERPGGPL